MMRLLQYFSSALTGLLLIPFLGFAQDIQFTLVPPHQDVNGFTILAITQDKQGYLWYGTASSGLYKYDGFQYTAYHNNPLNPNSIASNYIECLTSDKDGYIWIGYFLLNGGLDRLDPATGIFTHFRHQANDTFSLGSDSVTTIIQGKDGTIWVGTNVGLDRFDTKTNKFFHYQYNANDPGSLSFNQVRTIYEDKEGTIWVGTGNPFIGENPKFEGGLNKLDKKTGKFTRYLHSEKDASSLMDNRVCAIFEDSKRNFWVGSAGDGLHKMDRATGTFERLLYDSSHPDKLSRPPVQKTMSFVTDHITFITEDIKDRLWIGTIQGGINVYDPATQKTAYYGTGKNSKEKLSDNYFWKAYKTSDGIIWVSSWQSNLYKINPYQNKPAYTHLGKIVRQFAEDGEHNLWLATTNGLLGKFSSGKEQLFLIDKDSSSIKNFIISEIEKDTDNRLWMGTLHGLYSFDIATKTFTGYHPEKGNAQTLLSDTIGTIKKNNDGQLWLGTQGGLQLMDIKTGAFKNYLHDANDSTSISSNFVYTILTDKNGNIWTGGANGLNRLDEQTGHFKRYFTNSFVNQIIEDSKGVLWAGTQAGLFKYDKETDNFLPFSDEALVLNGSVYGVTEDDEQNLWINTVKGIIKLKKERNEAILFGKNQGVNPIATFNYGYKRQNGEILYGDTAGYFTFTNSQAVLQAPAPLVNITNFSLSNVAVLPSAGGILTKPIWQTKEIHLIHDQNTFSFEFANIDFVNAHEDTRLMYMLQNYDNAWRNANGNQAAYYFNLPPGQYIFKVKAFGQNGSSAEKEISIIITPPWWKTWWAYCIYGLLLIAAAWATHRYQKQRIIRVERERTQKRELAQAKEIEKAYTDLKQTQTQLIQSEKMASLGELTAGIAHEIQNPLNFVNNFSEVNTELIDEMQQEMDKGNYADAKTISNDIKENEQKINHHGKRADAIVKGMLQHSRTSNGVKEPTNINALAGEYLRLSYHGLRAKDKSFNATLKTDFDESIGNINVIPQDIGRVILNIITNAFYAVNERQKAESSKLKAQSNNYEPTVSVSTKKTGDKPDSYRVLIAIKDNGKGIPQKVLDKIFQPFFTTKPTGQGTGLGLSLAYDIVKAHGGEIKIETKEGEGSEFIIQLPGV